MAARLAFIYHLIVAVLANPIDRLAVKDTALLPLEAVLPKDAGNFAPRVMLFSQFVVQVVCDSVHSALPLHLSMLRIALSAHLNNGHAKPSSEKQDR